MTAGGFTVYVNLLNIYYNICPAPLGNSEEEQFNIRITDLKLLIKNRKD